MIFLKIGFGSEYFEIFFSNKKSTAEKPLLSDGTVGNVSVYLGAMSLNCTLWNAYSKPFL